MTTNVIYETDNYVVETHTNPVDNLFAETPPEGTYYPIKYGDESFNEGYILRNKTTRLVEATSTVYPEIVYEAERLTDAIQMASWRWFKVRRDLVAEGKIKDQSEHELDMLVAHTEKLKTSRAAKGTLMSELSPSDDEV